MADEKQENGDTTPIQLEDLDKVAGGVAGGVTDTFLKLDGIDGDSADDKHKGG
jgi:type VI protein secretion system component Hcp